MKKLALLAVGFTGLSGLLAGCDSIGSAPDGSASGNIVSTRTEYKLDNGVFVACDNILNSTARPTQTQVAVKFNLKGTIQSIDVGLVGTQSNGNFDSNFVKTITGAELASTGTNQFSVTFDANSSSGALLPLGITVNPVNQKVKIVTVTTGSIGSFYAQLNVNTGTATFSLKNQLVGTVPVYAECSILSTTTENVNQ